MATTQIIWQRHGIKETVACAFENANGHFGNLAVTLADARPAQVERLAQYLLRVRSFLSRTLDNLLNCELLTRQSAFLGELADRAAGAIFVSAKGEVTWISPRARALLGERTGSEEVPEQILRTCRLMHHAYAERLPALLRLGESERIALGGRLFVLRYRIMQVQGSTEVLVTIDDTTETSRGRARGLGLTSRELDVAALLVRGMANRQIAGILGISPNTVRNHASKVYERAGVAGRTELTRVLLE
jgi:DNA-binding CsgD family transcriptional regulator